MLCLLFVPCHIFLLIEQHAHASIQPRQYQLLLQILLLDILLCRLFIILIRHLNVMQCDFLRSFLTSLPQFLRKLIVLIIVPIDFIPFNLFALALFLCLLLNSCHLLLNSESPAHSVLILFLIHHFVNVLQTVSDFMLVLHHPLRFVLDQVSQQVLKSNDNMLDQHYQHECLLTGVLVIVEQVVDRLGGEEDYGAIDCYTHY